MTVGDGITEHPTLPQHRDRPTLSRAVLHRGSTSRRRACLPIRQPSIWPGTPPVCLVLLFRLGHFRHEPFLATDNGHPDALYLTCSDWPVGPPAATGALRTIRNVGNLVPTDPAEGSVDAALDFALNELGCVRSCAGTGCGAMAALLSESIDAPTSPAGRWFRQPRDRAVRRQCRHRGHLNRGASTNRLSAPACPARTKASIGRTLRVLHRACGQFPR